MRQNRSALLSTLAAGFLVLPVIPARAATVSVNFLVNFVAAQTVDTTIPYGVEEVPFWSNSRLTAQENLRDSTGTPTTLDFMVSGGQNTFGGANIDGTPMKAGRAFFTPGAAGAELVLNEIPYDNYKVITYLTGFNAGGTQAQITDGTTTYFWRPQPFSATLNQTTDTDDSDGLDQGNYAIFGSNDAPLTSDTLTLSTMLLATAQNGGGLGGFQVVEVLAAGISGDYNGDNTVDAADYTVWRDNLGQSDLALNGNGSGDASGLVVQADYQLWRDNYGSSGILTAVPEPSTLLLALAIVGWGELKRLRFA
jgi:hypothetical protein